MATRIAGAVDDAHGATATIRALCNAAGRDSRSRRGLVGSSGSSSSTDDARVGVAMPDAAVRRAVYYWVALVLLARPVTVEGVMRRSAAGVRRAAAR